MLFDSEQDLTSLSPADDSAGEVSLTVERAIANLKDGERGDRYYAAWWLGRFRVSEPAAVEALIAALADDQNRTESGGYPLRRNAATALGKLGDKTAVPALIECLDCEDFYVREKAAQSLGMLGDRCCIPQLMKLLEGGLAEATPIPGCPHLAQPYNAAIEALGDLGATEAIPLIKPFLEHPLELEKYGAARAMYRLTGEGKYGDILIKALAGEKLQLRRAALADLGAIGYLVAAEAISETLAENSLKIIALKGLLEYHVKKDCRDSILSEDAIHLMNLMDSLL